MIHETAIDRLNDSCVPRYACVRAVEIRARSARGGPPSYWYPALRRGFRSVERATCQNNRSSPPGKSIGRPCERSNRETRRRPADVLPLEAERSGGARCLLGRSFSRSARSRPRLYHDWLFGSLNDYTEYSISPICRETDEIRR